MHLADARYFRNSPARELSYAEYELLASASVVLLFLLFPGLQVLRRASQNSIYITATAAAVVFSPVWLFLNLILICSLGIDCL